MDGKEFYNRVNSSTDFEWIGCRSVVGGGEEVLVRHRPSNRAFALEVSAILENSWDTLEAVLSGRRQPKIMEWITRIVGYYSDLKNWNRSKIQELADRHRGVYNVPTVATQEVAMYDLPPDVVAEQLEGHAKRAVCRVGDRK